MTTDVRDMVKLGSWVVVEGGGLFVGSSTGTACYPTKRQAVADISASVLDTRQTPKVTRIVSGYYLYSPLDADTGEDLRTFDIVKVTRSNIKQYQSFWEQQWLNDTSFSD